MLFQNLSFRSLWRLGGVIAATMITAGQISAAVTAITGDAADYNVTATGNVSGTSVGAATLVVGGGGSPAVSQACILIFALPTLTTGQSIGPLTSLAVTVSAKGKAVAVNGDVWGVGNFPTALPLKTGAAAPSPFNFFSSSETGTDNDNVTATDTKIAEDFLTPATGTAGAVLNTPTGAGNTLQAYIQAFYTAHPTYDAAKTPTYVFLRINPDNADSVTGTNRYVISSANATTATTRPVLSLDIVTGAAAP